MAFALRIGSDCESGAQKRRSRLVFRHEEFRPAATPNQQTGIPPVVRRRLIKDFSQILRTGMDQRHCRNIDSTIARQDNIKAGGTNTAVHLLERENLPFVDVVGAEREPVERSASEKV
jgi:hypothetical protein